MADDIEIATDIAEADRDALVALHVQRYAVPRMPPRHAHDGQRICVECEKTISEQRLAAVPNAVACTRCESQAEKRAQHVRRRSPWAR